MKLRQVKKNKSVDYPTYQSFIDKHRLELGVIAAGLGLMLTSGCDSSANTGGKPVAPKPVTRPVATMGIVSPPRPVNTDPGLLQPKEIKTPGEMVAPKPIETKGKIKAPEPVKSKPKTVPAVPLKVDGEMPAPKPVKVEGRMAAPKPAKPAKSVAPKVMGDMVAPTMPKEEQK